MSQAGSSSEASIAIVGAGIIGMSIAWRLTQAGFEVSVFDKGPIGREASWAGAGMLSPGGEIERPSPLAALAVESRRLYCEFVRELEKASGLEIDYQECGALDLAYSPEEVDDLEARAAAQAAAGISSKPLTPQNVAAFWPRVRTEGVRAARFYPDDAIVNPRDVLAALELACRRAGVIIRPHSRVDRIDISKDAADVQSAGATPAYQAVIVAAGAWSDSIDVTGVPPLPVSEPIKGHLIGYQQPAQTCNTIVRHGRSYLLQRANGLLIAGASVERAGFDRKIEPDIVGLLAAQACYIFPHLNETLPSEVWTGFRPGSDELHIGAWHSPRLYLAYGHYRNGILLAPATAQRLCAALTANLRTR